KLILGISTYGLDEGVTLGTRTLKMITYMGGIQPNADPATLPHHQSNALTGNIHLSQGYFGVTIASFLLVPLRWLYIGVTKGWDDFKNAKGKDIAGLKSALLSQHNLFELAVNSFVLAMTAVAVFAPIISWPFVL